jgi:hypothetical protein
MPVNEAIELDLQVRGVLGMPRGALRRMLPAGKPNTAARMRPTNAAGGAQ